MTKTAWGLVRKPLRSSFSMKALKEWTDPDRKNFDERLPINNSLSYIAARVPKTLCSIALNQSTEA